MRDKIRIAMVAANLELNGISSVIMNYCRNINSDVFDITIFAGEEINEEFEKECNRLSIKIEKLYSKRKNKLKYYLDLCKSLKKNEFDIFHVHGNSAIMACELFIAAFKKIKIRIAHSHNSICTNPTIHKILNPLFKRLYTKAFACSEKAGEWVFEKNNFKVINNGINIDKYLFDENIRNTVRKELSVKDDEVLIGHIGRINYQKNQEFLLEIFEKICSDNNNYKLLLVGIGPSYEQIRLKVENSEFKDRIILYGESNEPERLYMAMDMFAFPSRYEGLPVTLVEAQVSGLPCIISDKITDEVILSEETKKIPIDSTNIWIDAIAYYASKKNNRNVNIEKFKNFDIKNNVVELEKYYKEFMEE